MAEQPFTCNRYHGLRPQEGGTRNFSAVWRASPLLLSAPHAVFHRGHGNKLRAEAGTGGLALTLADNLGASSLVRDASCFHKPLDDYFTELSSALRQAPLYGVTTVVDLHGCRAFDDYDAFIGLGRAPLPSAGVHWGNRAAHHLRAAGLNVMLQGDRLRGESRRTITMQARALGMAAVQIELTPKARFKTDGTVGALAVDAGQGLQRLCAEIVAG